MRQHNLAIRLQQCQRRRHILLCRIGAEMNQVGKLRGCHVERNIGKWFFSFGNDAMIGENGVGDHRHVPLGHMAARAVIGRRLVLP